VAIGKSQITTKVRTNQIILGICWRSFKVKPRQECVDDLLSCSEKLGELEHRSRRNEVLLKKIKDPEMFWQIKG